MRTSKSTDDHSALDQTLLLVSLDAQRLADLVKGLAAMHFGNFKCVCAVIRLGGHRDRAAIAVNDFNRGKNSTFAVVESVELHAPITQIALNRISPPLAVVTTKCSVQALPLSVVVY